MTSSTSRERVIHLKLRLCVHHVGGVVQGKFMKRTSLNIKKKKENYFESASIESASIYI